MGAVAREADDGTHVGTGKAVAGWEHGRSFEDHDPQWGEWEWDGPIRVRFCEHADCDLMDVLREPGG